MTPPDIPFKRQVIVMTFVALTQLVQMCQFGSGIDVGLSIAESFGVPPESAPWVAASYPLTQGAFLLTGGRLGAIYGHKNILFVGALLWVAFNIGTGFAPSFIALCILRAMSGIGGGIMMPNCIALLGITFPPGRMRNLSMALFVSCGPVGAAGGGLLGGIVAQLASWEWMFWFFAILGGIVFTVAYLAVPHDDRQDPNGKLDFVGSYLGIGALFLFNFVWNRAPAVGWDTPYVYVLLIVSLLHAAAFAIWEAKYASEPLVPITVWTRPSFTPLLLCVGLIMMSMGVFLWYLTIWQISVRHFTIIAAGASLVPLLITGMVMSVVAGWIIGHLGARLIVAGGLMFVLVGLILIGTMPEQQIYWKQAFIGSLIQGCGPDFVLAVGQVITANSVKRHEQGVAGSLIAVIQVYALSTGLGFASTVEAYTNDGGRNPVKGYRGAIFLAVGFTVLAMAINLIWVRMPAQTQEGWTEEDLKRDDPVRTLKPEPSAELKPAQV
ncbi:MFS general substrate transporter [Trametopsis cervina]|nr:MFS general substrate transporter [Trametopsis cervina]